MSLNGICSRWFFVLCLWAGFGIGGQTYGATPQVASGGNHTVALEADGTVWTWGYNFYGQLGDGTTTDRLTAVKVLTGVIAVSAGEYHTIALKSDGTVWAWGYNPDGRLGDGTTANKSSPVQVTGLTGVIAIAAGLYHSLALMNDNTVVAWGRNVEGQLGDGTTVSKSTPVVVTGLSGVTAIAAGEYHSLALKSDTTVAAWGYNANGQLGNGNTTQQNSPVAVSSLTGVNTIAAGARYSMALAGGTVWGWGYNADRQLLDGTTAQQSVPVQISGFTAGMTAIGSGWYHLFAVKSDGTLWGRGWNAYGQVGDGTTTNAPAPAAQVSGAANVVQMSGGHRHTVVRRSDGTLLAWGNNDNGRLGTGTVVSMLAVAPVVLSTGTGLVNLATSLVNVQVSGPSVVASGSGANAYTAAAQYQDGTNAAVTPAWSASAGAIDAGGVFTAPGVTEATRVTLTASYTDPVTSGAVTARYFVTVMPATLRAKLKVSAGSYHTLALEADGRVLAWGDNTWGQLGDGGFTDRSVPQFVKDTAGTGLLSGIVDIAGGDGHSYALKSDGTVWAWGYNDDGRIGDGTASAGLRRTTPVQVLSLTNVTAVAAGAYHGVALKADGTVWTWGANNNGQLGDGTTTNRLIPVQVPGLTDVVAISAGENQTVALRADGTVWSWGTMDSGRLGSGDNNCCASRLVPVRAHALTNVVAIDVGAYHTLALRADGTLWAWGYNAYGELGRNNTTTVATPVQVLADASSNPLTGITAIAAGQSFSVALKADGTLLAWGRNSELQVGDTTSTNRTLPVAVAGGLSNVQEITAGRYHAVARMADGTLRAWGDNDDGRLGDGTITWRSSPVTVMMSGGLGMVNLASTVSQVLVSGPVSVVSGSASSTYVATATYNDGTSAAVTPVWSASAGTIDAGGVLTAPVVTVATRIAVTATYTDPASGAVETASYALWVRPSGTFATAPKVAGFSHTVTLEADGRVYAWGYNGYGQLGDGGTTDRSTAVRVGTLTEVVDVATGEFHSLALRADGTVWAWGRNNQNQLGDTTTTDRPVPVQVRDETGLAPLSSVVAVAAGWNYSMALRADGTVLTWGRNVEGQLGDGTGTNRSVPVKVVGLTDVTAIQAGNIHGIALRADGTVWSWGNMSNGRVGDGSNNCCASRVTPVRVSGLANVVAISLKDAHALALRNDGTLWAWGLNQYGQVGFGNTSDQPAPVQVKDPTGLGFLTNVSRIEAGGYHSMAQLADGTVLAWGYNGYGQLGDATTTNRSLPVAVTGLANVVQLGSGFYYSLARNSDGTLVAWGNNDNGRLGTGTVVGASTPQPVMAAGGFGVVNVVSNLTQVLVSGPMSVVSGSASSTYVATATYNDGTSAAVTPVWGASAGAIDAGGVLTAPVVTVATRIAVTATYTDPASGTVETASYAVWVRPSGTFATAPKVAGFSHTVALEADGRVYAWGYNGYGQLGDGSTADRSTGVRVGTLTDVVDVATGEFHSLALRADGTVWSWGRNNQNQLGDTTTTDRPVPVQVRDETGLAPLGGVVAISAGWNHSVALKADGTVLTWGRNNEGELGDGTGTNRSIPVKVMGLTDVTAIAGGNSNTVALRSDGTVWSWGNMVQGRVGDGSNNCCASRVTPVRVSGLANIVAISLKDAHTLALRNDGTLWAWGYNPYGGIGIGNTTDQALAVQVKDPTGLGFLTNVSRIEAGGYHSLAQLADGTVLAWGYNGYGQLGDATTTNRSLPVVVTGLAGVVQLGSGFYYSLARKTDGTLVAWGNNDNGRLGTGTVVGTATPQAVMLPGGFGVVNLATNLSQVLVSGPMSVVGGSVTNTYIATATYNDGTSATVTPVWSASAGSITAGGVLTAPAVTVATRIAVTATYTDPASGTVETASYAVWVRPSGTFVTAPKVANGGYHVLSLESDGRIFAWGRNNVGQLGDNSTSDRLTAIVVPGMTQVVDVSAGDGLSLALKADGTVWAWGYNASGQLGDATTANHPVPMPVLDETGLAPLGGVVAVATGWYHSVALKADGTLLTWGHNVEAQLGDGTTSNRVLAVKVTGLTDVKAIAAGRYMTFAIRGDGTVWAWGHMGSGRLGSGDNNCCAVRATPVRVSGLSGVTAIAAGDSFGLALKSDGTLWGWGDNSYGQLGINSTAIQLVPVQVKNTTGIGVLSGVTGIAAGAYYAIALQSDGSVLSWGQNAYGQLGDGTTANRTLPVLVSGLTNIQAVASGPHASHTIVRKADGTLAAWGYNGYGELGNGTVIDASTPAAVVIPSGLNVVNVASSLAQVLVSGPMSVVAGSTSSTYTATATYNDGTSTGVTPVWSASGPVGTSIDAGGVLTVPVVTVAARVAVTATYTDPASGAVEAASYAVWVIPSGVFAITPKVTGGGAHSMGLRAQGTAWAWGLNSSGQLGDGSTTQRLLPVQVSVLSTLLDIAAGNVHSVALRSDGTVWAWGSNANGRLGDGTTTNRLNPVQVKNPAGTGPLTDMVAIAGGFDHTLALKADGTAWAWGLNSSGELGDGTTTNRVLPVQVAGLTDVTAIAAGAGLSLALRSDGTVWSWGHMGNGRLGSGDNNCCAIRATPVRVGTLTSVVEIAAGRYFGMARKSDGTVWAWGYNFDGQMGINATGDRVTPVQVFADVSTNPLTGIAGIAAGGYHAIAVKTDGSLLVWGDNFGYQLGDGTQTDQYLPTPLAGVSAVQQVGGGGSHTLAWRSDGTVYGWGDNANGRLGINSVALPPSPVQVVDIDGGGTFNLLADTRPDGFGFTPVITATPGATVVSNTVALSGIDGDAPISITGGEYSFDGVTFTTAPGILNPGASLTLRVQAAATFATTRTATVNVGGVTSAFSVTTVPQDLVPDTFVFAPKTGVAASTPVVSDPVSIAGINAPSPISIVNGEYSINGGAFTAAPGVINSGDTLRARVQSSAAALTTTWTVLTIGDFNTVFAATTGGGVGLSALIIGGPGVVSEGGTASYSASVIYSDGSTAPVSATWSLTGAAASINSGSGVLTANLVSASEVVTVTASYSDGSSTLSANAQVTIRDLSAAATPALEASWNLLGNSLDTAIDVVARFGNQDAPVAGATDYVVSVWKWSTSAGRWAFYSPQLSASANAAYAASKSYDVLTSVNPGEGYWVNAITPLTLAAQGGTAIGWTDTAFGALPSGFNLIATGDALTPSQFNLQVSPTPPPVEVVPTGNFLSLWAWDAAVQTWYFYSPLLESTGGLAAVKAYADSHSYRHFQDVGKTLGHGTGFWVNRP